MLIGYCQQCMQRVFRSFHANATLCRTPMRLGSTARNNVTLKGKIRLYSTSDGLGPELMQDDAFDAYSNAMTSAEGIISDSPPRDSAKLAVILRRAQELRASAVVRNIANNYLNSADNGDALGHALLESDTSANLLTRSQAIGIFNKLRTQPHNLEHLHTNMLIYIGHILIPEGAPNLPAMEFVLSTLLARWPQHQGVGHEEHFQGTWAIFELLRAIMRVNHEKGQLQFRAMLQSRPWWPEGSADIVEAVKEPATIVSLFTLRCCISWRWWKRAYLIAHDIARPVGISFAEARAIQASLASLMKSHMDATGLLLDTRLCAALICVMADHPSLPPLDNPLLQRFYRACAESKTPRPEVANQVYLYLRDKQPTATPNSVAEGDSLLVNSQKSRHSYLPPQGRRILSLLDLYHRKSDHNAARLLVSDVQKRLDTIPTDILAPYLIFIIKLSFATEARAVYSMCLESEDPDKVAITLLPSVSRHLVSLFVSMADAAYKKSLAKPKRQQYYSQTAQELTKFAWSVAHRFRRCAPPIRKWEHGRLTTLARINFAVGNITGGMKSLKTMINRDDILPDAHDMSVVLHAIASADPQAAAAHLDYMISRGLEPDTSAYGVVAAQSMKHGNFKLAGEILAQGRRRGRPSLDPKLLGALCWYNISPQGLKEATQEEIAGRLQSVLEQLGPSGGHRETVLRERTLGVRAANLALDIHRPDLALKFWARCIQFKTISPQQNEADVGLERDQERLLRTRILRQSERSTIVGWNLPQGITEILRAVPAPQPVKMEKEVLDEGPILA